MHVLLFSKHGEHFPGFKLLSFIFFTILCLFLYLEKKYRFFEILCSNLIQSCFVFNLCKFRISCSLFPVLIKIISSMNLKWINGKSLWKRRYIFSFRMIRKYIGIGRCTNSPHGSVFYFNVVFTVDYEAV